MIYFAQSTEGGPIKIGFTKDIFRRLVALQHGSASRIGVIGVCDGDMDHENALHTRFRPYRILGEWFQDCPPIKTFIEGNCRPCPERPAKVMGRPTGEGLAKSDFAREFAEAVQLFIADDGRSARNLARAVGVSARCVEQWRAGRSVPSGLLLVVLAQLIPDLRDKITEWMGRP